MDEDHPMSEEESREFYKGLRERIYQLRMSHLFEEPCTFEDEDEDDFFWGRMIYDNPD